MKLVYYTRISEQFSYKYIRSNTVGNKNQIVENVPYRNMVEMEKFSEKWTANRKGRQVAMLSGLCIVFHWELVQKIGGLDERFYPAYGEDNDFCIRAMILGKKLWVADDVFVHHYGRKTSEINGVDQRLIHQENREKFFKKWKIDKKYNAQLIAQREKPFNQERHYIPLNK